MSLVWEREMSHPQQAVLLALADHAHDDGTRIHPSYGRLAWKSGYSKRQVQRVVLGLIKSGAVVRYQRGGPKAGTNVYRLDLSVFPLKAPFRWCHPDTTPDTEVVTKRHQGSDKTPRGSDIAMSPESPSESPDKHKKRARVTPKDSRAEDETRKRRIRDKIHALRLSSSARDVNLIATLTDTTPDEVRRELETLQ